jgi:4-amino-4-deoxy-L-arabinose transferase-like glycosyltransferase
MDADAGPAHRRWSRAAQAAVLVVAAALRGWRLDQNGFDNEYYAAAVRSMMGGWHPFFYNSFDPAGFVSVDKPPLALWIQVAAAKVFGFSSLTLLLPQVLEGVVAVAVLMHLVGRRAGPATGALAGLFLALTPIAVAVDRSGNTDSGLVLVLLLAAWALIVAAERGHRGLLLVAMGLVGLGFNVKMLAAFVVLPTFTLVYWLGAGRPWRGRLADLAWGAVLVAAVSLPWTTAYDLTPASKRPFVGSSAHNSMLDLAVGHNGAGRFVRLWPARPPSQAPVPPPVAAASPPGEGYARLFVRTPVGPLRLLGGMLAAQALWLLPLALAGALPLARGGARPPLDPSRLICLLWMGWALTYSAVYSYAGGIFHFYYLATLGPPVAALAACGAADLWRRYRDGGAPGVLLAGALLLAAMWQCYVHAVAMPSVADDWQRRLSVWVLGGTATSAAALVARLALRGEGGSARWPVGALAAGLAALLLLPTTWALSSVLVKGVPVIPSADVGRLRSRSPGAEALVRWRVQETAAQQALIAFLQANHQGERFLLATQSAQLASPLIIATGAPVMAMGGFHGLDPILTPERLAALVETRAVRFVMLGDLSIASRYMGAESAGRSLAEWIRAHGKPLDATVWGGTGPGSGRSARRQLYDLKPEAGLVPASEKGRT